MTNPLESDRPPATASPPDRIVDATRQLARVLNRMGDALVGVDVTALLAVEGELSGALAAMDAVTKVGDHAAARAAARQALTALLRCRRLGASFSGVARALGNVGPTADGYDCMGGYVERARSSMVVRG